MSNQIKVLMENVAWCINWIPMWQTINSLNQYFSYLQLVKASDYLFTYLCMLPVNKIFFFKTMWIVQGQLFYETLAFLHI
ncbi:CLUMA_CG005527, isoform A [Clunio marinus]|uniref:CLUMA_CG005527, isoform A n=1 Tax=Clunio marinus TaxID=568069 RepID=A0A1J1HV79_9DIPT|nr:CLUMA_CG005527, isoform A [Clunio marinus]